MPDFIKRFEAAGGQLRHHLSGDGDHGVLIVNPRAPGSLAEFLPVLADPTRFEALSVYLREVWGTYVNDRHDEPPADWDGRLAGAA